MFAERTVCRSLAVVLTLALGWWASPALRAAEPPAGQPPAVEAEKAPEDPKPAADPLAVPDGTPEELLAFIKGLRDAQPENLEEETVKAFRHRLHRAVAEAATKILEAEPSDEQAAAAARFKVTALSMLVRLGDEAAGEQLERLAEEIGKEGHAELAWQARLLLLSARLAASTTASEEELKKLVGQIAEFLGEEAPSGHGIRLAMGATQLLEMRGLRDRAADAYATFGGIFAKGDDANVAAFGRRLEGAARRLRLVGKPMELAGKLLDGKPLDWDSYRGKVVLVQFWATWCGPCRREIVNIKKYYDLYHDKGFEVVGVNCDDEREPLDAYLKEDPLPWPNLLSDDPKQSGMDNPTAAYYGIMGIPTVMLVGKDGNVVSLEARGPALGRELEKLLGPPPEEKRD
jgi:thiol-disulfide isomerase/thioredoxin